VIERFIASGRDLGDVRNKTGKRWDGGKDYTALEIARVMNKTKVVSVLERFIANPVRARSKLQVELGALEVSAAELYAVTVFLCDDILQLKPASHPATAATRFFAIAAELPMELQMILCRRAVGSMKQNILQK